MHTKLTTTDTNIETDDHEELKRLYKERRRATKRNDSMIKALSESQSKLLSLEGKNSILSDIADKHQQKLLDSEKKEDEYKQSLNKLETELKQEKSKTVNICTENHQLQQQLQVQRTKMMSVTKQLSGKLKRLQNEIKLQELVFELSTNGIMGEYIKCRQTQHQMQDLEKVL